MTLDTTGQWEITCFKSSFEGGDGREWDGKKSLISVHLNGRKWVTQTLSAKIVQVGEGEVIWWKKVSWWLITA